MNKIRIIDIARVTAFHYGMPLSELVSRDRCKRVSYPRMVAVHIARQATGRSFPEIAARVGMEDHTSAIHAVNTTIKRLHDEPQLRADMEQIRAIVALRPRLFEIDACAAVGRALARLNPHSPSARPFPLAPRGSAVPPPKPPARRGTAALSCEARV